MNVYISSDMEGIAQVAKKIDVKPGEKNYNKFVKIQTNEIVNICKILGPNSNVTVRDAHLKGENILPERLPINVDLIQCFDGDMFNRMKGIDSKPYDFAILHGYNAYGGNMAVPLAHTYSSKNIIYYKLNDKIVGETGWSIYVAAFVGVPVCYIVGGRNAILEAHRINKNIVGTETKRFCEDRKIILSQNEVLEKIKADFPRAINKFIKNKQQFDVKLPEHFDVRIRYNQVEFAKKFGYYPGAERVDDYEIRFQTDDFKELLKMMIICR